MANERNKMMGHPQSGNVSEQEFYFPPQDGYPAAKVMARSTEEAEQKLAVLRKSSETNSQS